MLDLERTINAAYEARASIDAKTTGDIREAVDEALSLLDSGKLRVAEKIEGASGPGFWKVNEWLKKAVLLSFRLNEMTAFAGGPGGASWWDKVPSKFAGWGPAEHEAAGVCSGPGPVARGAGPFRARRPLVPPLFPLRR